jgi:hypothetical protein
MKIKWSSSQMEFGGSISQRFAKESMGESLGAWDPFLGERGYSGCCCVEMVKMTSEGGERRC